VTVVGATLSALHDVPLEEVARTTTTNARRFYRLDDV
jgi:Tat protein secretion system quality control protein TatD with DNase activity